MPLITKADELNENDTASMAYEGNRIFSQDISQDWDTYEMRCIFWDIYVSMIQTSLGLECLLENL